MVYSVNYHLLIEMCRACQSSSEELFSVKAGIFVHVSFPLLQVCYILGCKALTASALCVLCHGWES